MYIQLRVTDYYMQVRLFHFILRWTDTCYQKLSNICILWKLLINQIFQFQSIQCPLFYMQVLLHVFHFIPRWTPVASNFDFYNAHTFSQWGVV